MEIEIELLAEDWEPIWRAVEAVADASQPERREAGLARLLEWGLDQYGHDEAEWDALEGRTDPSAEARRLELQRREAQAVLVSMRARTVAAERRMRALHGTVSRLGAEFQANREAMRVLREENAVLEARALVSRVDGGPSVSDRGAASSPTWLDRLFGRRARSRGRG